MIQAFPFQSADSIEHMLEKIFAHVEVAVILTDATRQILMINPFGLKMFGYREGEILGQSVRCLYAEQEEYVTQGAQRFNYPLGTHSDVQSYVQFRRKDGSIFTGEVHGGQMRPSKEDGLYYLGFVKDVTSRLAADQALSALHKITSSRKMSHHERVQAIIDLGCCHFGLPIGFFGKKQDDHYQVLWSRHPENAYPPGAQLNLSQTYYHQILDSADVLAFSHLASAPLSAQASFHALGAEAVLAAPVFLDGEPYGTLNFLSPVTCVPFSNQDVELVRLFAEWIGNEVARAKDIEALKEAQERLQRLATTDTLTQLYNRRFAEQALVQEIDRSRRYHQPFTLVQIDFDHFKNVNDKYGHEVGDLALCYFADAIMQLKRAPDMICRWGGEEFVAILPSTAIQGAATFIARVACYLADHPLYVEGDPVILRLSAGVATYAEGDNLQTLYARADKAMYQAKHQGRNCIVDENDQCYGCHDVADAKAMLPPDISPEPDEA
ncbi:diguanylate cyclase [Pokkaliibacter sp. CJK22405]|uniref:diguanylate cyclase n=1 Tax=Pokkaliibacter sp. CJK22405 TaxID=3384615 RepID=UPI003984BCCA